ncbi:hypothetical protein V3C99_015720 [Haemonchus contortus]
MHLHIISLMCCFLLAAQESAKEQTCEKNVPPSVQKILLEVINEKCITRSHSLNKLDYNCDLAGKALRGEEVSEQNPYFYFDGNRFRFLFF